MTVQLSPQPTDDKTTTTRQPPAGTSSRRRLAAAVGGVLAIGTIAMASALGSAGDPSPSQPPTERTTVSTPAGAIASDAPASGGVMADPAAGPDDGEVSDTGIRMQPGLPDGRWRPGEARSTTDARVREPDCSRGGPC